MITKPIPESPIGVFDSGLGGLTVLKSLEKILPNESFIYFGDTAHVPYGNKSADTVIHYSQDIVQFFLTNNTKAVVIACNTASAVAYKKLRNNYDIPLFDVVEPSTMHSNYISKTRKIGVIGTHNTINTRAYTQSLTDLQSDCSILEIACPLFVPLIEEGWSNTFVAMEVARTYLEPFQDTEIDTLILGCTHYPILIKTIKRVINNQIFIIDTGKAISKKLNSLLPKIVPSSNTTLNHEYYVSDMPYRFHELASKFLKHKVKDVQCIEFK